MPKKIKTTDIFRLARLLKKVNVWKFIKDFKEKGAEIAKMPEDERAAPTKELGMEAFVSLLMELAEPNAEKEIYSLLESISGVEDIGNLSIEALVEEIIAIGKENNLTKVFSLAQGLVQKP